MLSTGLIRGHPALWLENELLRISVLPDKGADIYELIYKPSGVDFLYKTIPGLHPPGNRLPADIIENYEGGWQELFPNTGDACQYHGVTLPVHGEVALLPWEFTVVRDDDFETCVHFTVHTRLLPFRLERWMRLPGNQPLLVIEERVTNLSEEPLDFVWGHHLMLGGTFLENGCFYDASCRTLLVPDHPKEAARARLAPGQRQPWPRALSNYSDELIDLRKIPGPEIRSHDEVYLTDLEKGEASVVNPRLRLAFTLTWDASLFGCIAMWQPFGGLDISPWAGSYGVGMEPWVACSNLTGAITNGKSIRLEPKMSLDTLLTAKITETC